MAADGYVRDGEQAGKAHKIIEEIKRRRRHPIHLNRCRLLNYLVHGTLPQFIFFSEPVSDSFVLLRFIFNPDLFFLWLLTSYHIWLSRLILIHKSFLRIVMFSFLFWMKKRMHLSFRWSVPLFLNIVWGKSLSFWWSVPSFLIASSATVFVFFRFPFVIL